jgi:hypothetical protein
MSTIACSSPGTVSSAQAPQGGIAGWWIGGTNMTALTVDMGGQAFTGRLVLEKLA